MADLPTTTILVGLAVALARAIEWLAKASLTKHNGKNGNGARSGNLSPAEWEARMREIHREANEDLMAHMRALMTERNEKLREIIAESIRGRK